MPIPSRLCVTMVVAVVVTSATLMARQSSPGALRGRVAVPASFDLRAGIAPREGAATTPAQRAAIAEWQTRLPDLRVELHDATGATMMLWNVGGFLTPPDGRDPEAIAEDFVRANLPLLGLSASDLVDVELTDRVPSDVSGVTHLYYRQRVNGVPVYNGQLHLNIAADGRILSINNRFLPNVTSALTTLRPVMGAEAAVGRAARLQGLTDVPARLRRADQDARRTTELDAPALSTEPIRAGLMVLPVARGHARLVWNFQVFPAGEPHVFDYTVDAETGTIWTRGDWVAADQYRVYPMPVESPSHTSPAPPADGRVVVSNPAHNVASPFGWHDVDGAPGPEYTITRGNNAHAYVDADDNGVPDPGSSPDCGGGLDCSFPLDLTLAPTAYQPAAVTNLFYWVNIVHDVQHRYGFNEVAGNFQVNNYGHGGLAGDDLRAEAQDSVGLPPDSQNRNNANFFTPPDGQRPRMQMYTWTYTAPERDGDLDAGIIVHEYGHGISNRLVGGPANVNCLLNVQQPGEGISDWLGLVYTARATDTPTMGRGIGTYALGQPPTGQGIRQQRYSTDPAINTWTYESIADPALSVPHGVGSVWAQAMWEVYWVLVGQHGFSSNLYDANGGAGNQRAMLYHNEGLKNTACSPTFTQVRDGIIQAAQVINAGEDVCRLWDAFAAFGLGLDAVSGGSDSRTPTNGFNKPVSCGGTPPPGLSVDDVSVAEGNAGITPATFTVSLSAPSPSPVTVGYHTVNGTAVSGVFTSSRSNAQSITILQSGPASPYPSNITVPIGTGLVESVAVTLHGFGHQYPEDVDILLVGPGGQKALLLSDMGGATPVSNLTLTFRDDAPGPVPAGPLESGTYRPTNLDTNDAFASPAPPGPYGTSLSVFAGESSVGTWQLFVIDDVPGESGAIAGGWSLHLGTSGNDFVAVSGRLTIPQGSTSQTISVPVIGDTVPEGNETFRLVLSSPTGGTLVRAEGIATIVDDDDPDQLPEPPTQLRVAAVSGNTVTLSWVPPEEGAVPTGYVIEGGLSPGEVLASIPTGSAVPSLTFTAPTGSFRVRVHTLLGPFRSGPSNEILLNVNVPVAPSAPTGLLGVVDGSSLALAWTNTFEGGAPAGLVLDVTGSIVTSLPVGLAQGFSFAGVPAGTYTLRLRAFNAAGPSDATPPLTLTFPDACTGVPDVVNNLQAFRVGRSVFVTWDLPLNGPAPTGFVLHVTGGFSGSFGTAARAMSGVVAPGTYQLSVMAVNTCGGGPVSPERTVVVP